MIQTKRHGMLTVMLSQYKGMLQKRQFRVVVVGQDTDRVVEYTGAAVSL